MENRFIHGGNIYIDSGEWLDFSANINPCGLSPLIVNVLANSINDIVQYPDPNGQELKQALSSYYGIPLANIILGNGAVELLYIFFHVMRPKHVLLPIPSFTEYERAALSADTKISYFSLSSEKDFFCFSEDIRNAMDGIDCLVIGNPNNPTGNLYTLNMMYDFIKIAKDNNAFLLIDESFLEFLPSDDEYTLRHLTDDYEKLFVIQSMTKFYALPGLRLGFGVCCQQMKDELEKGKDPWNVNILAQKAGVAAVKDRKFQFVTRKLIKEERNYILSELCDLTGLEVYPSQANFLLLDLHNTGHKSGDLAAKLQKQHILIRDCSNYPGLDDNYVRLAVRNRQDNIHLLQAIKNVW